MKSKKTLSLFLSLMLLLGTMIPAMAFAAPEWQSPQPQVLGDINYHAYSGTYVMYADDEDRYYYLRIDASGDDVEYIVTTKQAGGELAPSERVDMEEYNGMLVGIYRDEFAFAFKLRPDGDLDQTATGYGVYDYDELDFSRFTFTYKRVSEKHDLDESDKDWVEDADNDKAQEIAKGEVTRDPTVGPPTGPSTTFDTQAEEVQLTGGDAVQSTKVHNGMTGVTVKFTPTRAIGYRLFRSEDPNELGISCTDFYITAESFADVNVEPNTTYYYTLKEVLAEADPFNGVDEQLGDVLATWVVTTRGDVDEGFEPGARRVFIVLTMNDPMMSVDGIEQEVDPGRGTTPINYKNRTMVPIRAIVEAMGGEAGWDNATRGIDLAANGNTVQMWVDKKDLVVNGEQSRMDVPPIIQNERTFVPVRFSAENLNCKVDWLNSTQQIVIAWSDRD